MKNVRINQKSNFVHVEIGVLDLWFSYNTPIAFNAPGSTLTVRENDWGPTTGKHLNSIDGGRKENRISGKEFEERLSKVLSGLNV